MNCIELYMNCIELYTNCIVYIYIYIIYNSFPFFLLLFLSFSYLVNKTLLANLR